MQFSKKPLNCRTKILHVPFHVNCAMHVHMPKKYHPHNFCEDFLTIAHKRDMLILDAVNFSTKMFTKSGPILFVFLVKKSQDKKVMWFLPYSVVARYNCIWYLRLFIWQASSRMWGRTYNKACCRDKGLIKILQKNISVRIYIPFNVCSWICFFETHYVKEFYENNAFPHLKYRLYSLLFLSMMPCSWWYSCNCSLVLPVAQMVSHPIEKQFYLPAC